MKSHLSEAGNSKVYLLGILASLFLILATLPFYRYKGIIVKSPGISIRNSLSNFIPAHESLLFFPYYSIQKEILMGFPSYSKVRLYPIIKNGFYLKVQPVSRVPVAKLNQNWCLDSSGAVFRCRTKNLRLVRISLPMKLRTNRQMEKLLSKIEKTSTLQISKIQINSKGDWVIYTKNGICVKLGQAQDMTKKIKILLPILQVVQQEKMAVADIDVRVPQLPVLIRNQRAKTLLKAIK